MIVGFEMVDTDVPSYKETVILENSNLYLYDVILCISKTKREHKAPVHHLMFWHQSSTVCQLSV